MNTTSGIRRDHHESRRRVRVQHVDSSVHVDRPDGVDHHDERDQCEPGRQHRDRPGGLTVEEYLDRWLQTKQSLRPGTRMSYQGHLRRYLIPHLGAIGLMDLRPHQIATAYTQILKEVRCGRPIGATTLRRVHATLSSALNSAVRQGLLSSNPAVVVELPPTTRTRTRVWTAEQLRAFLDTISEDRLYLLYRLLGLRGLRRGEALGLRWCDVDLDARVLHISQQVSKVGSVLVIGPPKSAAGIRAVVLDAETANLLLGHRNRQRTERRNASHHRAETGLVFTTAEGMVLDPAYVSRHFDRLVARHGLPRIRLHDLRHASASIGLATGETLLEVSRRLGHSSITVTADIYAHTPSAMATTSAERMARTIFNHPGAATR